MMLRRIIWRSGLIAFLFTICGCGNGFLQLGNNSPDEFTDSSFNGEWIWYEKDIPLYALEIKCGRVVSVASINANAKGINYQQASVQIDPHAGLGRISFIVNNGDNREIIAFTFDNDGNYGESGCKGRNCSGVRSIMIDVKGDDLRFQKSMTTGTLRYAGWAGW